MMKRMCPEHHITNYVDIKSVDEYSSNIVWSMILYSMS